MKGQRQSSGKEDVSFFFYSPQNVLELFFCYPVNDDVVRQHRKYLYLRKYHRLGIFCWIKTCHRFLHWLLETNLSRTYCFYFCARSVSWSSWLPHLGSRSTLALMSVKSWRLWILSSQDVGSWECGRLSWALWWLCAVFCRLRAWVHMNLRITVPVCPTDMYDPWQNIFPCASNLISKNTGINSYLLSPLWGRALFFLHV